MHAMRRACPVLLLAVALILMAAPSAKAVITTEVVVLLGAELPGGRSLPAVEHGLEVCTTPSLTWDGDERPTRTFLGQRLGTLDLHRKSGKSVSLPVPTPKQVEAVHAALKKAGIEAEPRLLLVVQQSGGR